MTRGPPGDGGPCRTAAPRGPRTVGGITLARSNAKTPTRSSRRASLTRLAEALGRFGCDVRVAARDDVGRPQTPDPRDTGGRLGVDHVLTGSVRRAEHGLRIALRVARQPPTRFPSCGASTSDCEPEAMSSPRPDWLATSATEALAPRRHARGPAARIRARRICISKAAPSCAATGGEHLVNAVALLDEAARLAPDSVPIHSALAEASIAGVDDDRAARAARGRRRRRGARARRRSCVCAPRASRAPRIRLRQRSTWSAARTTWAWRSREQPTSSRGARGRRAVARGARRARRGARAVTRPRSRSRPATARACPPELAWLDGFDNEEASAEARPRRDRGRWSIPGACARWPTSISSAWRCGFSRRSASPALARAARGAARRRFARAFAAGFGPRSRRARSTCPRGRGCARGPSTPQRPLAHRAFVARVDRRDGDGVRPALDLALAAADQLLRRHGLRGRAVVQTACPSIAAASQNDSGPRARAHDRAQSGHAAYVVRVSRGACARDLLSDMRTPLARACRGLAGAASITGGTDTARHPKSTSSSNPRAGQR